VPSESVVRRGYVLAGGRSSRMGRDKARIPVQGVPMAERVAGVLAQTGLQVTLIRRGPAQPDEPAWHLPDGTALPVIREPDDGAPHPLHGVVAALEHARAPILICPCDVPDLHPDDVRALLGAGPSAVAWDGQRVHPLLAVLDPSVLDRARRLARAGGAVRDLIQGFRRVRLPAQHLRNVNRPQDLVGS